MEIFINTISQNWYKEPGATLKQIEQLKHQLKFQLVFEHEAFLLWSNGGEAKVGNNYFSLWSCEEIVRRNVSTKIEFYLPNILGIATDGGDYCYALDYNASVNVPPLVLVPLGDLDFVSFVTVGSSLKDGLQNLFVTDF